MTPEVKDRMMKAISILLNETMYHETSKISDDIAKVDSTFTTSSTFKGKVTDEDGDEHRTLSVRSGWKFNGEEVNTGMSSDRALLLAHRMIGAAYGVLRRYGSEGQKGV